MHDNQAIAEHEQELTSLLVKVLKEPLRPLGDSLKALKDGLDGVSDQVGEIHVGTVALQGQQEDMARGLETRAAQGDERLEAAVLQLRTVLLERGEVLQQQVVDRLVGFEAVAEQHLARLEHGVAQSDSARRAEEQLQVEWRSRQEEAQCAFAAQLQNSLRASVRPLKFLLAGTFALAVLSLAGLVLVASHLLA